MDMSTTPLAPGQRWVPTREGSRAKARVIVWRGDFPKIMDHLRGFAPTVGWVHDPKAPSFRNTGHDSWMSVASFRAWIARHEAVLQEGE